MINEMDEAHEKFATNAAQLNHGELKTPSLKLPTIGRIVIFYPSLKWQEKYSQFTNTATKLPAIVVQEFGGLAANLKVLLPSDQLQFTNEFSVTHVSQDYGSNSSWDWPEIK